MIQFKIDNDLLEHLSIHTSTTTAEGVIKTLIGRHSEEANWYAFVLCSGSYPNRVQMEYMRQLSLFNGGELFNYFLELNFAFPGRGFEFVPAGSIVFNVTSSIDFPFLTGIQRFVRNFYDATRGTAFKPVSWDFENSTILSLGDFQKSKIEKWILAEANTTISKREVLNLRLIEIYRRTKRSGFGSIISSKRVHRGLKKIQKKLNPNGKGSFILLPAGCDYFETEANADPAVLEKIALMHELGIIKVKIFCHDILPITYPHLFPKDPNRSPESYLLALQRANLIVVASEELKNELIRHRCYGPIQVVNGMPGVGFSTGLNQRKRELSDPSQIVTVGTLEPRKNHLLILAACKELWSEGEDFELVIVGNRGWMCSDIEREIKKLQSSRYKILWEQYASDSLLLEYVANSKFTVYVPTAEGLGLPVIEAAEQGKLTIASRIPSANWLEKNHPELVSIVEDLSILALKVMIKEKLRMPLEARHPLTVGQKTNWYLELCNVVELN